jgi:hypothetical protein
VSIFLRTESADKEGLSTSDNEEEPSVGFSSKTDDLASLVIQDRCLRILI